MPNEFVRQLVARWIRVAAVVTVLALAWLLQLKHVPKNLPLDYVASWTPSGFQGDYNWRGAARLYDGAVISDTESEEVFHLRSGGRIVLSRWKAEEARDTFSFWFQPIPEEKTKEEIDLGVIKNNTIKLFFYLEEDRVRLYVDRPGYADLQLLSEKKVRLNEWNHLALVRDQRSFRLFLNGEMSGELVMPKGNTLQGLDLAQMVMGNSSSQHWPESIAVNYDGFSVFLRPLNGSEVMELFQCGRRGLEEKARSLKLGRKLQSYCLPILAGLWLLVLVAFVFPKASEWFQEILLPLFSRPYLPSWTILVVGCILSIVLSQWLHRSIAELERLRFNEMLDGFAQAADTYFERAADLVFRARDTILQNPEMATDHWEGWIRRQQVHSDLRAVVSLGYALLEGQNEFPNSPKRWKLRVKANSFPVAIDGTVTVEDPFIGTVIPFNANTRVGIIRDKEAATHVLRGSNLYAAGLVEVAPAALTGRPIQGLRFHALITRAKAPGEEKIITYHLGVAFIGIDLRRWIADYWNGKEPPVGYAVSVGSGDMDRQELAVSSEEMFPATARPSNPDLSREIELKVYKRRLVFDFWPTEKFSKLSPRWFQWGAFSFGLGFTLLSSCLVFLQNHSRLQQAEARRALESAFQEKRRLRRDLHDNVVQNLYALGLQLKLLQSKGETETNTALKDDFQNGILVLDQTIEDLRTIINEEGRETRDTMTIQQAMTSLHEKLSMGTHTRIELYLESALPELGEYHSIQLLSVTREAVSNALRHGKPDRVKIRLEIDPQNLQKPGSYFLLTIIDDGSGFNSKKDHNSGHGLSNMRERSMELNGEFACESAPGKGTRVSVRFPVDEMSRDSQVSLNI